MSTARLTPKSSVSTRITVSLPEPGKPLTQRRGADMATWSNWILDLGSWVTVRSSRMSRILKNSHGLGDLHRKACGPTAANDHRKLAYFADQELFYGCN